MDQKATKFDQPRRVYIQLSGMEGAIVIIADQIFDIHSSRLTLMKSGVQVGAFSQQWLMGWWTEPKSSDDKTGNIGIHGTDPKLSAEDIEDLGKFVKSFTGEMRQWGARYS